MRCNFGEPRHDIHHLFNDALASCDLDHQASRRAEYV